MRRKDKHLQGCLLHIFFPGDVHWSCKKAVGFCGLVFLVFFVLVFLVFFCSCFFVFFLFLFFCVFCVFVFFWFCDMRARPLFERLEGLGLLGRKESLSKWIKYHRMTPKIKNFWLTSDLMFRYECCLWQMSCIWQCQSKQIVSIQQIQYLLRMSLIKPFSVSTIMCEKSPVIELKTKLFSLSSEFFPAFSYCFDQFFRIFVIKDIYFKSFVHTTLLSELFKQLRRVQISIQFHCQTQLTCVLKFFLQ